MKNYKMAKAILVVACIFVTASMLFSCGKKEESTGWTGWEVKEFKTEEAETPETQTAYYNLTRNSKNVEDVWLNIGGISHDSVDITVAFYYTSSMEYITSTKKDIQITKDMVADAKDGWVRIIDGWDKAYSSLALTTTGGIQINEIVVLNAEREAMDITLKNAKLIFKKDGSIRGGTYTSSEIADLKLESDPSLTIDEQNKFSKDYYNDLK